MKTPSLGFNRVELLSVDSLAHSHQFIIPLDLLPALWPRGPRSRIFLDCVEFSPWLIRARLQQKYTK